MIGARNEAMALTNCPNVRVDASLSPPIRLDTSGLSDVCMMALPIPSREKDSSITTYPSPNNGINSEIAVTIRLMVTVRLRPMRFISIPVGTEKIRNQKNTKEGNRLACESVRPRSFCT